jgi:peptide/nickel transport system substrate-binding protein
MGRLWSGLAAFLCVVPAYDPASAGKADNSIRFAYEQVVENIDPYFNSVRGGFIISQQVWDTLIYRDPRTNEYKGQLATAWRWIDDRTLEVELRKGVQFHDGRQFDADDVVYTLNFVSNPANRVLVQQNVSWIERAEKVDQYKVLIRAKRPFPAAIEYLAGPVVIQPRDYHTRLSAADINLKPVGSGPYRVVEHALGKYVRLRRNPEYFKDSPKPQPTAETVEIRFIPDRQTQVAEMLSGNIDFMMNVTADQARHLRGIPSVQVKFGETMRVVFLQFNATEKTPASQLRDVRVRRAIAHAINRDEIVKAIVGEGARVLHVLCFPTQFGCTDRDAPQFAFDPAKAAQLLADAGLPNGFDLDFYAFRERDHAEAMIGYLRNVGIRANLRFMQYAAVRDAVRAGTAPMTFQSWGSFSINDVSAIAPVFFKFALDDIARDGEVRDLLERGDSSVDPDVRRQAYGGALALIQERAYALPLYSLPMYYVAGKDLEFTPYPDEMPRFWEMTWK